MKRENVLWIICILIILGLCFRVYTGSQHYDCYQCTVQLSNKIPGSERYYNYGEFNIRTLFEAYNRDGECLIKWDPTQGYINNGYPQ